MICKLAQIIQNTRSQVLDLVHAAEEERCRINQYNGIIQRAFGGEQPAIRDFVDFDNITHLTFARLVVYFLCPEDFINVTSAIVNQTPIVKVIPGSFHFRQVSIIVHPDKSCLLYPGAIQGVLASSYDQWKSITTDESLKDVKLCDKSEREAYCKRGPVFQKIFEMYDGFMQAMEEASKWQKPVSLGCSKLVCELVRQSKCDALYESVKLIESTIPEIEIS
jgi:hypothetical protein